MQKRNLVGTGISPFTALNIGGVVSNTQTATGSSSQANSFAIVNDITVFTTAAANTGARLPLNSDPGDTFVIHNADANTMLIYPPVGGKLNTGTLNASANLTTLKTSIWTSVDGLLYVGGVYS